MRRPKKRRAYDASRRRLRAEESRERMLEVARRLFAERGYSETTIEAIASAADVAVPTVYAAFQSKRGVLSALMTRLASGEPGGTPLLETAGPREVMGETDPRRVVSRFVAHLAGVQERVIPTYDVMKSAARTEPDVAQLLVDMQAYRFSNIATIPKKLDALRALRSGLSIDEAARTIWALASPEVRQMLLTFAGWSVKRYRAWLEATLVAVLLPPTAPTHRKRQSSMERIHQE
jgi:AcrR family transcriptional regulator